MKVEQERKALIVSWEALKQFYLLTNCSFTPAHVILVLISEQAEAAGASPQIKPFLLVDVSSFILSLIRITHRMS